jgi:hypothetical protein
VPAGSWMGKRGRRDSERPSSSGPSGLRGDVDDRSAANEVPRERSSDDSFWAIAIVQHSGSAPVSDYCFTAPERLLAPSMSANASVLTKPRSAVAMLLECAVVRFRGAEPECCCAWWLSDKGMAL